MTKVNGKPADSGCYLEGHRGQYALDGLADICEQFDIAFKQADDPRYWRKVAEEGDEARLAGMSNPEDAWEQHVSASDTLEALLNEVTEGGYWEWDGGEFFLVQTQVEGIVYVRVEPGEDYDDAWRLLVEHGPSAAVNSYDDIDKGERAYQFRTTVYYEPEES